MRIAVVANPESPHVIRWIDSFEQRGHTVRLFAPAGLDYECERRVFEFGRASAAGVWATFNRVRDLRRALREFQADIVHGQFALNYGTWAVLARIRPVVVSAWGSDLLVAPRMSRSNSLKVRLTVRLADALTCNSKELARAAVQLGAPPSRVHRIVFGVNTDTFTQVGNRSSHDRIRFLSTRQLAPIYRVDRIVRAFAESGLSDTAELVISSFGPEAPVLRELVSSLGLTSAVHMTGRVSDQEMLELYRSADVYVSIPESDSTAVSILEAMSTELPVIASDLPVSREWLGSNGEGGLLVGVGDDDSLVMAMRSLAGNSEQRHRMGVRNRSVAIEHGNWNREVDKMLNLFELLIKR